VIRYVLFKTQQNSGCPIKRDELTQLVTKNYRQRALAASVINVAREKLSSIFGYELRELQRSRPLANQGRSSQQSKIMLLPILMGKHCCIFGVLILGFYINLHLIQSWSVFKFYTQNQPNDKVEWKHPNQKQNLVWLGLGLHRKLWTDLQ